MGNAKTPVLTADPVPTVTKKEHVPLALGPIEPALNPDVIVGRVALHRSSIPLDETTLTLLLILSAPGNWVTGADAADAEGVTLPETVIFEAVTVGALKQPTTL